MYILVFLLKNKNVIKNVVPFMSLGGANIIFFKKIGQKRE